jgi:spore coat polysaccharide biosynthesis protein SpsF
VQARVGSERLPAKVMRPLEGKPLIGWVVERAKQAALASRVICALPETASNDGLARFCASLGAAVHRGPEHDVLARYLDCCERFALTDVVRITGDCPLIDPAVIDRLIRAHTGGDWDLTWNPVEEPGAFPRGMDVEVVRAGALRAAAIGAATAAHREHVTLYCYDHPAEFRIQQVLPRPGEARPELRLCVDHEDDARVVQSVIRQFRGRNDFTLAQIVAFLDARPEIAHANDRHKKTLDCAGR